MPIALAVLAVALGTTVLLMPTSSRVDGAELIISTRLREFRFDLRQAVGAEPVVQAELNRWTTVRLFGVGWPLKPFGWFRNGELGTFLSMVNDPSHMWLVRFPGRQVLVSPENAAALDALRSK